MNLNKEISFCNEKTPPSLKGSGRAYHPTWSTTLFLQKRETVVGGLVIYWSGFFTYSKDCMILHAITFIIFIVM
jgi:hypothetical protein